MYTEDDVLKYVTDNKENLVKSLDECDGIPSFMKKSQFQSIWDAGCWLGHVLRENGASDDEKGSILFVHGQRCFGNDPVKQAVLLANEFVNTGTTEDRPGMELADKINQEILGFDS